MGKTASGCGESTYLYGCACDDGDYVGISGDYIKELFHSDLLMSTHTYKYNIAPRPKGYDSVSNNLLDLF